MPTTLELTEIALLRDCLAKPETQYIYADWLEDQGRGEEAQALRKRVGFLRKTEMNPAYDKRDSNPAKNYGIHCVNLRMILVGPQGAVQFLLYTGWHLPHIEQEWEQRATMQHDASYYRLGRPMPADLGYHSRKPRYEEQEVSQEACEYLGGRPCYYDGSGLNAEPVFEKLLTEGDEGVWKALEEYYRRIFCSGDSNE